jgi:hypothetical protein
MPNSRTTLAVSVTSSTWPQSKAGWGKNLPAGERLRRDWAEDVRGRAFRLRPLLPEETLAALVDLFAK